MRRGRLWWHSIRELHDWAAKYEHWEAHVAGLNDRNELTGERSLSLPGAGWLAAWFTGDIERLEADQWVLVVSLNPALARGGHYESAPSPEQSWRFWCEHNLNSAHWNSDSRFFPRLVDVARHAFGGDVAASERPAFATNQMLLLEFCPYASRSFIESAWPQVQAIADGDIGFAINRQIRSIAIAHGRPRLILVNGRAAVYDVNDQQRPDWRDTEVRLPGVENRTMRLWTGVVRPWRREIPILGFDFLGRPPHRRASRRAKSSRF